MRIAKEEGVKRISFIGETAMDNYILGQLHMVLKREEVDFTLGQIDDEINIELSEENFIKYILHTIK